MVRSKGPVWHKKQKDVGIMPKNLRGVDREATWAYSKADNWIYGHGTFCLTSHEIPVLGQFRWMPNSKNESKVMYWESRKLKGFIETVCMDSKADDVGIFKNLKNFWKINLLTKPRKRFDKTDERKAFVKEMNKKENKIIYKDRSTTVEPMQGLVSDIFGLERAWMRGNKSNRWIFAAMGVAVQMAQMWALTYGHSTWKIKQLVLGL